MTTPYCSKSQWAHRQGWTDWTTFTAAEPYPTEAELDDALEDAADIMNDREHINCRSTNITDSAFTQRLERINYNMANRILQIQNAETIQGSNFSFSPQDFLYNFERKVLQNIGLEKGHLKVGDVA